MAWTYTANPAAVPRDAIRLLVGDTVTTDQQLQDGEIDWMIAQWPNAYVAASEAASAIAAKYARQANIGSGATSVAAAERMGHYVGLAALLRLRAQSNDPPTFFAGGQTLSGKQALSSDSDATQPSFRIGQDDLLGGANNNADYHDRNEPGGAGT